MLSRPHFSVAQEVLDGKSATQTLCRDSFLPSLYKWAEVIHILNAFLLRPLYNCNPAKCQSGWSQSPIKELTLSSALRIYDRLQKSMAALEGCSCKILPKGLKMEQAWWMCNYKIEILSSPKVAFHSYYCQWESAFTLLFMFLSFRMVFIFILKWDWVFGSKNETTYGFRGNRVGSYSCFIVGSKGFLNVVKKGIARISGRS